VADIKSEPRPASNRNRWPDSYRNAWPASSESALGLTSTGTLAERLGNINKELVGIGDKSAGSTDVMAAAFGRADAAVNTTIERIGVLRKEMGDLAAQSRAVALIGGSGGGAPPIIRNRAAGRHGGDAHVYNESGIPLGGGYHIRGGSMPALAAGGALAYGAYEQAEMEDAIFQLSYHTGMKETPENVKMFRGILQGSLSESGFSLPSIIDAAKTEARMFKGTPGNGIEVMPEMLRAAAIEARLKGTSLEESMQSLIGLAHMTKEYSPEEIKKLAPAFAFLSASNPASLSAMERAASYAVPILQSGMEIDPMSTLLLGTVLTRAGATNSKSGTWLRNMMQNSLPGTSLMSKVAFAHHEEALKDLGLIDSKNRPTWFTDGKPDPFKMLDIASAHAAGIPLIKRGADENALFGKQGEGAFALLADPAVRQQVNALKAEMNGSDFQNRYANFSQEYSANSSLQAGRQTWGDAQNVMMDIGQTTLPPLVGALRGFDGVLKAIKATVGDEVGNAVIGTSLIGGVAAWLTKGAVFGWLGKLLGLGAGAASLPAVIDALTDDNRTPQAKANDAAVLGWITHGDGTPVGGGGPANRITRGGLPYLNNPNLQGIGNEVSALAKALPPPQVKVDTKVDVSVKLDSASIAAVIEKKIVSENRAVTGAGDHDGAAAWQPPDMESMR
jgi:hypothetical protein